MQIREMTTAEIKDVLPLYISYYNEQEGGCWTEESASKQIHQVLSMEDSFSLILEQAVNDEQHEKYYGKAGYHNAKNFVMKVKWFE